MAIKSAKFKNALRYVLKSEGGNDDDPNDEGGRTGQGITQAEYNIWLRENGLPQRDVWDMPDAHRDTIYCDKYWTPVGAEGMPLPVAYVAFDATVLHGENFSRKAVQRSLNVKVDGIIGKMTLAAANAIDPELFEARMRDLRWARMQTRPSFPSFKAGWEKRLNDVGKNVRSMLKLKG